MKVVHNIINGIDELSGSDTLIGETRQLAMVA